MFEIRYTLIKVINARIYIDKNKNYLYIHFLMISYNNWEHQHYQRSECSLSNYFVFMILLNTKWSESHSVVSDSLSPHGLYSPWNSPEYWSGWPFPSPGYLPNPGIEPRSPTLQADFLPSKPPGQQIGKQPTKWGPKLMSQQTHSAGF